MSLSLQVPMTHLRRLQTFCRRPLPLVLIMTMLGLLVAVPSLWLSTRAESAVLSLPLWDSYLQNPLILILNFLPPLLLLWGFTLLTDCPWAGYLLMLIPGLGLPIGNYFKIAFRGDPVILSDLTLLNDAARVAGGYSMDVPAAVWLLLLLALGGFILTVLLYPTRLGLTVKTRLLSFGVVVLSSALIYLTAYTSQTVYNLTDNTATVDRWSSTQVYLSRGIWYPFLNSGTEYPIHSDFLPSDIKALLDEHSDPDLQPDTVTPNFSVVGIMLEGFTDLTELEGFAQYEGIQEAYTLWHQLEEESLHGNLVTNIFGGGTVNTEWGFLSGLPDHQEFVQPTDSYVWNFRNLGYTTLGTHPGYSDFYNRINVNQFLGFQSYRFYEDTYADSLDMMEAHNHSDDVLIDCILDDFTSALQQNNNVFSFSVSLQNHGPYEAITPTTRYTPDDSQLSETTRGWIESYLNGLVSTQQEVMRLRDELESMDEPVVMVLFGDHLPWLGNGYVGYFEAGVSFELERPEDFYDYYSTPYIIWANSAAQAQMDSVELGDGGSFSPCFLMNRLYQFCNWTQPAAMKISSALMSHVPVVHQSGRYLYEGDLVDSVPSPDDTLLSEYFALHAYRRENIYIQK